MTTSMKGKLFATLAYVGFLLLLGSFVINRILSLKAALKETSILKESYRIKLDESQSNIETILHYLDIDGHVLSNTKLEKIRVKNITDSETKQMHDEKALADILKQDCIVFRFFLSACNSCITEQITKLEELSLKTKEYNVVLITDYISEQLGWYLLENQISLTIYETRGRDMGVVFDNLEIPYLFVSGPNLEIKSPFVLSMKTKTYSNHFYESVVPGFEQ